MISFLLVIGDKKDGKRCGLNIQDIIQMYKSDLPKLFRQRKTKTFSMENLYQKLDKKKWLPFPLSPYELSFGNEFLEKIFEDTMLGSIKSSNCIAAAVAREYNEDPNYPDKCVVFDTDNEEQKCVFVKDILRYVVFFS